VASFISSARWPRTLYGRTLERTVSRAASGIAIVLGVVYVFGAILGMFWLLWRLAVGHGFPAWPWWGYILAPLGIAVVYFALELLNWPIHRYVVEPDRVSDPTWERGLRFFLLLVIGCGWIAICVAANHYLS